MLLLKSSYVKILENITEAIVTPKTADSSSNFFDGMFDEDLIIEDNESIEAALQFQKEQEIQEEIKKFSKILLKKIFHPINFGKTTSWNIQIL